MLKNITQIEAKVGEKSYHFSCDQDAPLQDVKEALFRFQKYVGQIEDAIKAQEEALKAKQAQEKVVEMPSEAKAE